MNITHRTLTELIAARTAGEAATKLVADSLAAITAWEPAIHAFREVLTEEAHVQADTCDRDQPTGRLHGIPIAIKDNILTREGHTTAASRMLENFRAPYDSTVITKLKQAGAIIIGKTNLDEFAMGASTEYSAFGPTKNPWDTTRVPGGSSGGSAAAVASGEVAAALGTDTGGSIRHPAAFCGIVGVRPTYGRVSRFGAIAYGSSLDQIGPLARTVRDAALLLEVIAGHDPHDATTSKKPVGKYVAACGSSDISSTALAKDEATVMAHERNIVGLTVGVPEEYFAEGVDENVRRTVTDAVRQLSRIGCKIKNISLPLTPAGIPVYYLLAKAEGASNLARYDALRFAPQAAEAASLLEQYTESRGRGFGAEVKRTILMGTYALAAGYVDAWYKHASRVRTLMRREFETAFANVDIIAGPTAPEVAFPFGGRADPLAMYLADILTTPASVAGLPAISLPCGFADGLPVGLQLTGKAFAEETLFALAHAYEQSQQWWKKVPELPNDAR
ncbi:MAG: Asp-tRNA(Asn)/Glu-tRNA(Gln) amidotransferase GatCAB subunit A [Candidatus Andersenbacteria bacterium CG10_big_fil_rev_8_21_14_0_10_54_11]|uniref:Glutamyl-tRNA(Gln) amidotransferase subunit A n=1 Tax=Candidatus Andersenbacteria bacterium CG10_big_fil_rev_8_21_14_0_10_54_11 TaxID=1974485 RepID=A0A2M6WY79_9BACT|nr:MAG: Asp-tRNA(Asn)/Glu-tRNA(Gln) amidotransferase GatCAB subunit A [Candidatus Andersenbacteria bacterium CG10_big_fil_rev_8_21_14_0_10_54_11]